MAYDLKLYTEETGKSSLYINGELTGASVEMVREIMRRIGKSYPITVAPWARGYDFALNEPNVVLFATTRTKERESLFQWVGPIIRIQWVFVARKVDGLVINSLEDAKKVGGIGTYKDDAREQELKRLGFTNLVSKWGIVNNYKMLEEGRLDLVAASSVNYTTPMRQAGVDPDDYEIVYSWQTNDLYIAFSKQTPASIVQEWREAFESMRQDGMFQAIYSEWYPGLTPPMEELR